MVKKNGIEGVTPAILGKAEILPCAAQQENMLSFLIPDAEN